MRGALTALALGALAVSTPSRAAGDCGKERPWLALASDASLEPPETERVRRELEADFAAHGIDVCADDGIRPPPLARILLSMPGVDAVAIRVEIRDAVTAKEVARTVSTANIPRDGRAVAIALASAELLQASWAEITLRSAPQPPAPVPAPVRRVVDTAVAPLAPVPVRHLVDIGVAFAGEAFTSGFARLGADVRVGLELTPRVTASVRAGFRRSPTTTAPDGTVDADAFVFGLEGAVDLLRPTLRWRLDVLARFDVVDISFHPVAVPSAVATASSLVGLEASGGLRATLWIIPTLGCSLEAGAGAALLQAEAKDGPNTVVGTTGLLVSGGVALSGRF